jgi:hypothetical protein
MSCYYCGGQRNGCAECRKPVPVWKIAEGQELLKSMQRQPITADTVLKQEIVGERVIPEEECPDTQRPAYNTHDELIKHVQSIDSHIQITVDFDLDVGDHVIYTKDLLTHETRQWKWSKFKLINGGYIGNMARDIVRFWIARRRTQKIPGY